MFYLIAKAVVLDDFLFNLIWNRKKKVRKKGQEDGIFSLIWLSTVFNVYGNQEMNET